MRQPSTPAQRWAWWEAAIRGDLPPITPDAPQQGYFKIRKWRTAQAHWTQNRWLPARIYWRAPDLDPETGELMADEICLAEIDGRRVNPWQTWPWLAKNPISEEEWRWLRALSPLLPGKPPKRPNAR